MGKGGMPGSMPNMGNMGMGGNMCSGMAGNMGGNMGGMGMGGNTMGSSMMGNMGCNMSNNMGGNMPSNMPSSMPNNMPNNMPNMGNNMGNNVGTSMDNNMAGNNMGNGMGNGMMGMGGMNPMMAMMGMMMGMQAAMQGNEESDATPAIKSEDKHIDPRVKAICNDFGISGDTVMRLNDAMREREDYDEDLQALHKLMDRATKDGKKPLEVMLAQIRAIRANRFPGKELLDPDIWEFIVKYNLDDRVMNRLIETLNNPKRKGKSKDTLQALNDRLGNAQQPTGLGLLVRLLEGLDETGRLPSPPRRLGGSGTFRPTGTFLHPAEHERSRHSERRSRSRGRDARRSRSRRRS